MGRTLFTVWAALGAAAMAIGSEAVEPVWPTPNRAFLEGRPYAEFVQPTESGEVESGLFGCTRTNGRQFHEGLDLFPLKRDKRGEPADPVFVVLPGRVLYANAKSGTSTYGRYVVVEHTRERLPAVTLYAHLAAVDGAVHEGADVTAGQVLGKMGRSASSYTIPKERGHVHVEAGLWLSRSFPAWYESRDFDSPNDHGVFNGRNIIAFDYLDYLERCRAGQVRDMADYVLRQPTGVTVVVAAAKVPDFLERYPLLRRSDAAIVRQAGWRIDFTWFGLPVRWFPVDADGIGGLKAGEHAIVFHDPAIVDRYPCQGVVRIRGGQVYPGTKLEEILEILFK